MSSALDTAAPAVEIVLPTFNEEQDLEWSVTRLVAYLREEFPFPACVTIADNASSDRTWQIAERLAGQYEEVRALRLEEKGRGRALAAAWTASEATVVAYMDVDLSTDLRALLPLVAPILSGHSDLAIGSRLVRGAHVRRGPKREVISRGYNLLLKATLRAGFSDAQCGFKAVRAATARRLLPAIEDTGFFFDTELLVLAQRSGLRITEVPVDWTEDADSRVDIVPTAVSDLQGIWRLLGIRELLMFAAIGLLSTAAYAALFWGFRSFTTGAIANLAALAVTAVANTAANRRFTFGVSGCEGLARDHLGGAAAFVLALAITNFAMLGLALVEPHAGRELELAVLVVANVVATLGRFALLRRFIRTAHPQKGGGSAPLRAAGHRQSALPAGPDRPTLIESSRRSF